MSLCRAARTFPEPPFVRGITSTHNMYNLTVVKRIVLFTKDSIRMVHSDGRTDTVVNCDGKVEEMWANLLSSLEECHHTYREAINLELAHPCDPGFVVEYHVMVPGELYMASMVCNEQPCDCDEPMQRMSEAEMMRMVNL